MTRSRRRAKTHLKRMILGLCIRCGKSPPVKNRRCCMPCAARLALRGKHYRDKGREAGRCAHCSQLAISGLRWCEHHARTNYLTQHKKAKTTRKVASKWNPNRAVIIANKAVREYRGTKEERADVRDFILHHPELWDNQVDNALHRTVGGDTLLLARAQYA